MDTKLTLGQFDTPLNLYNTRDSLFRRLCEKQVSHAFKCPDSPGDEGDVADAPQHLTRQDIERIRREADAVQGSPGRSDLA